ncbi:MAG: thiolase domain-containing protein [Deltaproteobacteria bacterium]|nr:thiolase domain-containing protein [Deltaproteobacteria bacterium]MCB9788476.1 thiolase domain-containing protein [Deltaproteobacteria bacterium]
MVDVAIVAFAQRPSVRNAVGDEVELVQPVIQQALEDAGLRASELGFVCSGSCDYLIGRPFSFVTALDAVGAWPPLCESHVEMDGAFAFYEAWVRLQHGDVDTALVYAFGRSSLGSLPIILSQQLDPYTVAPLFPDAISLAALQARALLDGGRATERDFAEVACRSRRAAEGNPNAQLRQSADVEALLGAACLRPPLRVHDCPPISDGACAMVLATGERARAIASARGRAPAWVAGVDHRIDPQDLGSRDLTRAPSAKLAAERAGAHRAPLDLAELHAPFSPQELILREAMGLGPQVAINPSGGALAANPMMVAGLTRVGEAALRIHDGRAGRALAHATSGPCLQQNLVCVLEAR